MNLSRSRAVLIRLSEGRGGGRGGEGRGGREGGREGGRGEGRGGNETGECRPSLTGEPATHTGFRSSASVSAVCREESRRGGRWPAVVERRPRRRSWPPPLWSWRKSKMNLCQGGGGARLGRRRGNSRRAGEGREQEINTHSAHWRFPRPHHKPHPPAVEHRNES